MAQWVIDYTFLKPIEPFWRTLVKKICLYVLGAYALTTTLAVSAPKPPTAPNPGEMSEMMQYILIDLQAKRALLAEELAIRKVPSTILPSWADLVSVSTIDTSVTEPEIVEGYLMTETLARAPFTVRGKTTEGVPVMYVLGTVSLDPRDPARLASCTVRFDLYADINLEESKKILTHVRLNLLNESVPILALTGATWKPVTDPSIRTSLLQRLGVEMPTSTLIPEQPIAPPTPIDYGI